MKMNLTRTYEMKLYDVEKKKHKITLFFWTMITLLSLILIVLANSFLNNIVTNTTAIIASVIILLFYLFYLVKNLAFSYNRDLRFFDKYDFNTPEPLGAEEEDDQCVDDGIIKL